MSAIAIVVLAVVAIWLVGMLVAGILRSGKARAAAPHDDPGLHRSRAEESRTEAAVRKG
jgi:hypothetical protein